MMALTGIFTHVCFINGFEDNIGECAILIGTNGFMILYHSLVLFVASLSLVRLKSNTIAHKHNILVAFMLSMSVFYGIGWSVKFSNNCYFCPEYMDDLYVVYVCYTIYSVIVFGMSLYLTIYSLLNEK